MSSRCSFRTRCSDICKDLGRHVQPQRLTTVERKRREKLKTELHLCRTRGTRQWQKVDAAMWNSVYGWHNRTRKGWNSRIGVIRAFVKWIASDGGQFTVYRLQNWMSENAATMFNASIRTLSTTLVRNHRTLGIHRRWKDNPGHMVWEVDSIVGRESGVKQVARTGSVDDVGATSTAAANPDNAK